VNDVFSEGIISIIADVLTIVAIITVMLFTDWRLTLVCLIPFPILIIATYYFKESVNKSFHQVRNAVAKLNAFVQEHITGMYIVQAFAAENRESDKFKAINKDHRDANIHAIFAYSVFFPIVEIVLAFATGLAVWWFSKEVLHTTTSHPGVIFAFIQYLNLIFRPLRVIADKFNVIQMGMIASDRVFKLIDNDDYIKEQGSFAPEVIRGKVTFDHVWFGYTEEHPVLKNINFEVQPGQTIAIVGHTGSGKTTIISLLNRLYEVNKGQIRIDDVPIQDYQLDVLRKNVGVVLQD